MRLTTKSRRIMNGQFAKGRFNLMLALITLLTVGLTVGLTQTAYATDFRGGDTIIIGADEVIDDDLFVGGQAVIVNGRVKGNLFAGGTTVTVNGHVEGSLFMGGQELINNGTVDGSVYVGGYGFTMGPEAAVGRNLSFGGFSMTTAEGSQIGRSLYAGGYQMILNGKVVNDVNIGAGALELNGVVGGDVLGEVDSSASGEAVYMPSYGGVSRVIEPGMRIAEDAQVGGDVNVVVRAAPAAPAVPETSNPVAAFASQHLRWVFGELIALLLVGVLFLAVWPKAVDAPSAEVQSRWLPDLGVGLLTAIVIVIGVPLVIALLIAVAVLGGWLTLGQLAGHILAVGLTTIGLGVAVFFFVAAMLTKIIVAYTGGRLVMTRLIPTMEEGGARNFVALVVGLLIYMLLRAIPFGFGFVIGILVTLVGLGAITMVIRGPREPMVAAATPTFGTPTGIPA